VSQLSVPRPSIEAKASTPEELKARLVDDIKKWSAVIEKAGIPKQ